MEVIVVRQGVGWLHHRLRSFEANVARSADLGGIREEPRAERSINEDLPHLVARVLEDGAHEGPVALLVEAHRWIVRARAVALEANVARRAHGLAVEIGLVEADVGIATVLMGTMRCDRAASLPRKLAHLEDRAGILARDDARCAVEYREKRRNRPAHARTRMVGHRDHEGGLAKTPAADELSRVGIAERQRRVGHSRVAPPRMSRRRCDGGDKKPLQLPHVSKVARTRPPGTFSTV